MKLAQAGKPGPRGKAKPNPLNQALNPKEPYSINNLKGEGVLSALAVLHLASAKPKDLNWDR
jgi:hypothetical protein